jgi:hypothetical protein
MKEIKNIEKELFKTLRNTHSVSLKDGSLGMIIDWEIHIVVVTGDGKKIITTTDNVKKVIWKDKRQQKVK